MMRLSLCMIWLSVFQHVGIANPKSPFYLHFEEEVQEESNEQTKDWFYSFFVGEEGERLLKYSFCLNKLL